jgi:proteasome accessory factor B
MPVNVSRIYRLLRLVNLLQGGRTMTANELADDLQVSRRTIFRDLNALELAHIPYYYDAVSKGYRISQTFFLPPVNLTLAEAMALLVMTSRLGKDAALPLLRQGTHAAAKIESVLPKPVRDHVGSVLNRLSVSLPAAADHEGLDAAFDALSRAIAERRICRMQYESFHEGETIDIDIHPLRLAFVSRAWYVLAWTPAEKQIRTYKLVRIHDLQLLSKTFAAAPEAELSDHFGLAWSMIPEGKVYNIHLHFKPMVAGNVAEVRWHDTQEIQRNDDGSIEFHVKVDGLREITWWILGYGDQVKVVKPKALARRVAEAAARTAAQYDEEAD